MLQKRKFSDAFKLKQCGCHKQIYFSPTFLKSRVYISDNIASIEGGAEYNYREYRRKDFPIII